MKRHPPDRRLDPPEPSDDELREEKLRDEWEREQELRDTCRVNLNSLENVARDALGAKRAKELVAPLWKLVDGEVA